VKQCLLGGGGDIRPCYIYTHIYIYIYMRSCSCAAFCVGIHHKHPTHALQHAPGTTPLSGTPCELHWPRCFGKSPAARAEMGPGHRQNGGKQQGRNGTWTQLGGTSVGRGVPSWLLMVWGVFDEAVGAQCGAQMGQEGAPSRDY
jgi:hypothetical protein